MTKKKTSIINKNEVTSIYDKIPDEFKTKYHNPSFADCEISHPFRMLVVGASGSGKTSVAVYILSKMADTFGNIKYFCRSKDEPIIKYLEKKIPRTHLQVYEGIADLPDLNEKDPEKGFDPKLQHLVIFDDLVLLKDQTKIVEYFIRARKIAKGISIMYLTQSFFRTPKTIRLNINYLIIKKLSAQRDLNLILSEFSLGCSKKTLIDIYKYCTAKRDDFLMIDIDQTNDKKFKHNLLEVLEVPEDE